MTNFTTDKTAIILCPSCLGQGHVEKIWSNKRGVDHLTCKTCSGEGFVIVDRRLAIRFAALRYQPSPPSTTIRAGCCV